MRSRPARPATSRTARPALLAGLAVLTVGAMACAGCSPGAGASGAAATGVAVPEPTLTATGVQRDLATPTTGSSLDGGCTVQGTAPPAGASVRPTADLDHDGRADEVWLARANGQQLLGVRTAAGGSFATPFEGSGNQRASAVGQALDADTSVLLLSQGDTARLFSVVDCSVVPTTDALDPSDPQITFALDSPDGTGVGCEPVGDSASEELAVYGLNAHAAGGGTWDVSGTRIELSNDGRQATRGAGTDLVTGAAAGAAAVRAARTVSCGDQQQGATEPAS